ncbi:MAG: RidA family protein [Woeseiaceae bacterium]|nr:RidA family protein [Woeseiaceae bacterium]
MTLERVSSGAPWETKVGYCRATCHAGHVAVSGTAAVGEDGAVVGVGDPYAQTKRCLEILMQALEKCGASASDVMRTRIFVTNIDDWSEIGRAHAEVFGESPPATSMVEVSRLIHPDMVVEIEADAVIARSGDGQ